VAVGFPFRALYRAEATAKLIYGESSPAPAVVLRCQIQTDESAGLAMPSVLASVSPHLDRLPVLPIWLGLFANTLFFALLYLLLTTLPAVRRRRRRQQGRCQRCGYLLKGAHSCPECGNRLTRRCSCQRPLGRRLEVL